jgi:predicted dehydrogenase
MTAFKLRYYPMVKRAMEFIGRPLVTVAQMMDSRWPDDFWANDTTRGGGNVVSQGCHTMDLICLFNRTEPVRIYAEGGNLHHPCLTLIDNIVATVMFQNGSIASVIQGDSGSTPYLSKFSFQLMDGVKTVHLYNRLKTGSFFDGSEVNVHNDSEEYGFLEENREFICALQRGAPVSPNHKDGLRATLLVLKAIEAIKTGVPQDVKL